MRTAVRLSNIACVALASVTVLSFAQQTGEAQKIEEWLKGYDVAFNANRHANSITVCLTNLRIAENRLWQNLSFRS